MFIRKTQRDEKLEEAIDALYEEMKINDPYSEEYSNTVAQLVKLMALRNERTPKPISPDTLAMVAGNLLGILLIVGFEQTHVMTSKAIGFVMKSR